MRSTTVGQLLLEQALPAELRDQIGVLDKPGVSRLFQLVAEKYPERYAQIAKDLSDIGRETAYETGGYSFGLKSLRSGYAVRKMRHELDTKLARIYADPSLSDDDRETEVLKTTQAYQKPLLEDVYKEAKEAGNPLAMQIASGARGNKYNLNSLLGADLLYVDHRDKAIPVPVRRSYSQGLRPIEYFAGAFGARKGLIDLKMATSDSGYLAKQLTQAAHRLLVSAQDDDEVPFDADPRGLPVETDDPDNEGSLLASPVGEYSRNTVLTPKILKGLQAAGHGHILVRSPLVGGPRDGGVYARDAGYREKGGLAPVGDYIGIAAAQALCLAGGTEVRMADGSVARIEDIVPGDIVLGCDVTGRVRPVLVVDSYANGEKPVYATTFRLGTGKSKNMPTLRSTLDHKLLTVVVPNKTANRRPAACVSTVRRPDSQHTRFYAKLGTSFDDAGYRTEPYALALGLLTGDGSYTGGLPSNGIGFSCYDEQLVADVSDYFVGLGCRLVPQTTPGEYRVSSITGGKVVAGGTRTGVRNPIRKKLLEYDLWGQCSYQKRPPGVDDWDNASVAMYLGGLFASDGTVTVKRTGRISIGFGSTSERLAVAARSLLMLRFGVYPSSISAYRKKRKRGGRYRRMFRFTVNGYEDVRRFAAAVSLPGIKGRVLAAALDVWRHPRTAAESGRCAFVSQIFCGTEPTFDIQVDHPDHLFVLANGLVVSNSEPITQSSISSKHSGGVAGASAGAISGFKHINAMIQSPKTFPGGAAHAQVDGRVEAVRPAPQGGSYVMVGDKEHYVGSGVDVTVKPGDDVEAGDVLSAGTPIPAEVVRHKGIGEGRRYFTEQLGKILRDSGITAHRRNVELLGRGLINHVRLTEEVGDWAPDDVVPYQLLERGWQPRAGHTVVPPQQAVGQFLERPVLHYSVGTPIRKSMLPTLERFGVRSLHAHKEPPPFTAEFVRGMANISHDQDWMSKMLGSFQQKSLLESARRGAVSDESGTSYVPALARGVDFGRTGPTKGWKPGSP